MEQESKTKLYTTVSIKSQNLSHKILIDIGCDDFSNKNSQQAKEIKDMIKMIKEIIYLKPEIKNAQESDILYY